MNSILVFSEKYWPYGGAELATHLILKLLKSEGFDVTVVEGAKKIECIKGIRYFYSPLLDVPSKIHLWRNLIRMSKMKWLNDLLEQSDIVYINRLSYPLIPLAKRHGKKVIVHLHNYQLISYCAVVFHSYGGHSSILLHNMEESLRFEILENESIYKALLSTLFTPLNRLNRVWVSEADNVICVSKRQAEIIKAEAPELANKIKLIYNPLPNVRYTSKNVNEPRFLYVGGSSFCKGVHILAKASTELLKRNKCNFTLTNITSIRWQQSFKELNKVFNGSFSVFDKLNYERLLRMHPEVTALVFPSILEEPLPYSILEAMLSGTIPIASWTGGIPEIVHGTFAEKMLFTPGNVKELVERMEFAMSLTNGQLIDIGQKLRQETLRRFNYEQIRKELLEVFSR